MRAHAAAVSTAGPGAAAKTIRMHNEPVEPNRCPPLGLSLYKDRKGTQRVGLPLHTVCECLPLQQRALLWSLTSRRPGGCGDVFETLVQQLSWATCVSILKRSQRAATCSLSPSRRSYHSPPERLYVYSSCYSCVGAATFYRKRTNGTLNSLYVPANFVFARRGAIHASIHRAIFSGRGPRPANW